MAGIYLHIPFCKKACHYCDFHFSTSSQYKSEMLKAIAEEIKLRQRYTGKEIIQTIYFGGGTPSLLTANEINHLLDGIYQNFEVADGAEITLEANPDDLIPQNVKEYRQTPVNRFSIGVQSFYEEDLVWMNRAHNSREATSAVKRMQDAGFDNLTLDLIYGYPLLSAEKWEQNILQIQELNVPHLSAYSITVEPDTALASFISKGKQKPMDEAQSAAQFLYLMDQMAEAGFEHYEISNFAKPGKRSRHNSNYWKRVPYLGLGPSAHSFNGESRQWNVANNLKYIAAITAAKIPAEIEILTVANQVNEYIMTAIRTTEGLDLSYLSKAFGHDIAQKVEDGLPVLMEKGWLEQAGQSTVLTRTGKLYADHIASSLFIDEAEQV